jgi:hypothetical protein
MTNKVNDVEIQSILVEAGILEGEEKLVIDGLTAYNLDYNELTHLEQNMVSKACELCNTLHGTMYSPEQFFNEYIKNICF